MEISSETTGFVNAFGGIPYIINATAEELVEVSIFGSEGKDNVLAMKALAGQPQYTINVAPFIYQNLTVEPLRTTTIDPKLTDRVKDVFIGLKNGASTIYSSYAKAYAGVVPIMKYRPMSDRFSRSVVAGEIDEVSLLVDNKRFNIKYKVVFVDGTSVVVNSVEALAAFHMVTIVVDTKLWAARYPDKKIDKIEVAFEEGPNMTTLGEFRFVDRKSDTITLKWVNKYGAIDSYSFDNLHQQSLHVTKRKIYHQDTAHIVAASIYTELQIAGRCETPQALEWLSGIIRAPRVWIDNGTQFEPVDVLTDKVVSKRDELSFVELTLKKISQDKIQIM